MKLKTLMISLSALSLGTVASAQMFNEFEPNPAGTDPAQQIIEFKGMAGATFSGVMLSIDSDPGVSGTVDRIENVNGTFDANGLFTILIADLENPSNTVVLTSSFSGAVGDDLDADDDGTADTGLSNFGTVFDAVNISDAAGDDILGYADDFGFTNFINAGSEPTIAFRDGITNDWYQVVGTDVFTASGVLFTLPFTGDPLVTSFGPNNQGAVNVSAVPEPATMAILGLAAAAIARKRRK